MTRSDSEQRDTSDDSTDSSAPDEPDESGTRAPGDDGSGEGQEEFPDAPTEDDPGSFVDPVREPASEVDEPDASAGDSDSDADADTTHADTTDAGPTGPEANTESESDTESESEPDPEPGSLRAVMDELKDEGIAEDVDMDTFMAEHSPVRSTDEDEGDPEYVQEWRERVADAKGESVEHNASSDDTDTDGTDGTDGGDTNTTSDSDSTRNGDANANAGSDGDGDDGGNGAGDEDEIDALPYPDDPLGGEDLGLLDGDLDLSGLQEQQEVTKPTRGYDITYRDPSDDAITNRLRGEDAPESATAQRRVAAQLAVVAINGNERPVEGAEQCITDALWASFVGPVKMEIGIRSMAMIGTSQSVSATSRGMRLGSQNASGVAWTSIPQTRPLRRQTSKASRLST